MEGFDPSGRTDQGHWSSKGITFRRCQGRCGLTVPPSHSLSRNLHRTFFPFFFSSDCHLSSFHFLNPLPNSTQTRHFEFFKIPFGRDHFGMRTSWLVFRDKYTVPLASVANYYFTLSIRESCTNFFCNDRTRKFRKILFYILIYLRWPDESLRGDVVVFELCLEKRVKRRKGWSLISFHLAISRRARISIGEMRQQSANAIRRRACNVIWTEWIPARDNSQLLAAMLIAWNSFEWFPLSIGDSQLGHA